MVATPIGAGTGGLGLTIIDLAAYFYANDGIMASTQTERLHRAFDVLTGLFDRVGLRKKTAKPVDIVCQLYHAPGRMLEEAYKKQMTGKGPTFWEFQRKRVELLERRVEVAVGSLTTIR